MPGCEMLVSEHSHLPWPQLQASWLRSSRLGWALHGLTSNLHLLGMSLPRLLMFRLRGWSTPGCDELVSEHSHLPWPQLQISRLRSSWLDWALHGLIAKRRCWEQCIWISRTCN